MALEYVESLPPPRHRGSWPADLGELRENPGKWFRLRKKPLVDGVLENLRATRSYVVREVVPKVAATPGPEGKFSFEVRVDAENNAGIYGRFDVSE